jgi:hypothetical protein
MRPWERQRMIRQKMAAQCADTPYSNGWLAGQLNALQYRLAGIALPREYLDSLLIHLHSVQAECKKIIPASSLLAQLAQKKGLSSALWVVLYRRMHVYFVDQTGLRLCRTLDLPLEITLLTEEVKKIYRYVLGQKWLSTGEGLKVRCLALAPSPLIDKLPVLEGINWHIEPDTLTIRQLWRGYKGSINCLPLHLQRANAWRDWNKIAWRATGLMLCGMVGVGGNQIREYLLKKQQLQQVHLRVASTAQHKKRLGKTARALLEIAAYQQKYAYPNYETLLLRLSHILNDFPLWSMESIEWQQSAPHKLRLVGKWQAKDEQMTVRFERTLTRQLQAKQLHIALANPESGQFSIEINFDMAGEEG